MPDKRYSVMVLPRDNDSVLLQSFTDDAGAITWDGFGSFYTANDQPLETALKVSLDNFGATINPASLHERAKLRYLINKSSGLVDLHITIYFADVSPNHQTAQQTHWFDQGGIPYAHMHPATGKWLPIILEGSKQLTATIKVEQPGDHTTGEVTDFIVD